MRPQSYWLGGCKAGVSGINDSKTDVDATVPAGCNRTSACGCRLPAGRTVWKDGCIRPYRTFGGLPHTDLRVIATRLRRCQPDEAGIVVSRYHRVAGRDWLAIPLVGYPLPSTDDSDDQEFCNEAQNMSIEEE